MAIKFLNAINVDSGVLYTDVVNDRVGIGTTAPNHELTVQGSANPNIELKNTNYSEGGFVLNRSNYGQQWKWWAQSSVMYIGYSTDETTYTTKLTINSGGNIGLGTTSPTNSTGYTTLTIDNATNGGQIAFKKGNVSKGFIFQNSDVMNIGTSVAGDFAMYSGNLQRMTIKASGNVGIGTTSPDANLEVFNQTAGVGLTNVINIQSGYEALAGAEQRIRFRWETGAKSAYIGAISESAHANTVGLIFGIAASEKMRIANNGNVGIGTTSPTYKLDVSGTGRFTDILQIDKFVQIPEAGTTINEALGVGYLVTDDFSYVGNDSVTRYLNHYGIGLHKPLQASISGGKGAYMSGYFGLDLFTQGTSRLHINQNGNVGVGTSSPQSKLHISDYSDPTLIISTKTANQVNSGKISFREIEGTSEFELRYNGSANRFDIWSSLAGETLSILRSNGNVGVGTSSPQSKLHIQQDDTAFSWTNYTDNIAIFEGNTSSIITIATSTGGQSSIWFADPTSQSAGRIRYEHFNDELEFWTAGLQKMVLTSAGNVGIGITSPTHKLDVSGEIHTSTYVSASQGLGVDSTTGNSGHGISLYNGPGTYPQYGLLFAKTSTQGTHGAVTADWATYMTMSSSSGRGWIWKAGTVNSTGGNVFSVATSGACVSNSTFTGTNFILSSDETLKNNIKEINPDHIAVNWKNFELKSEPGVKRYGVIAQELEKKHPEFVRTDDAGLKSVAYIDLLIAKISELEARLEKAGI